MGLILLAGTGAGLFASAALSRRAASFEQMVRFTTYMETQIRYSAAPIREILERAVLGGEFTRLAFLPDAVARMKKGERPVDAWDNAVCARGEDCGLTPADRCFLIDFGRGLGKSDVEGQLSHCETFRRLLDDRLQASRGEAQSKGKLYVTLGIAGGLGVALLLY